MPLRAETSETSSRLLNGARSSSGDRKAGKKGDARPCNLKIARGLRPVRLCHLQRQSRVRQFELCGQALAISQFGDLIGTLGLLDGAGTGLERGFRGRQVLERR